MRDGFLRFPSECNTCQPLGGQHGKDLEHTGKQGGHGTGKTGHLVLTFSRQGKHREFGSDTGKNLLTQGKYLDCDY